MTDRAPISELSDADLAARAGAGELDAFEQLVRRHQNLAVHAAWLIVANTADAEDAVQNAFYKAFVALKQATPVAVRPWLLTIVAHEARNLRLAEQRRVARQSAVAETWSNASVPGPGGSGASR